MTAKTFLPQGRALQPSLRSSISSFMAMDIMRAAAECERAGASIIHMEVGQPGTAAPRAALEAALSAIAQDTLGYTLALGLPELREKIAKLYQQWYGLTVSPDRVVVTTGSSGAFVLAFLALFDAGARVGLTSPGYPCYRHILTALGCDKALIEIGPGTNWMPDVAAIEAAGRLDGLLLASPANPTGTMLTPQRLAEIARWCARHGIAFISDEIYHGLTYGAPAATALQFSDDAFVVNSFSKYFSMTGWRVGWMVVPERFVRVIEPIAQNLFIAPPAISQAAAIGAFDGFEELERNRAVYAANREMLLHELPKAGFETFAPADGAFYLYADVAAMTSDSADLARRLLDDAGVAVTPGLDFDVARGHRFVRFSYAGPTQAMTEAAARLKAWRRA
ncbi:MAG TPA: aminotransferase class I/II-fold pyridoxal phosphate-dependent enzyme [Hyphomicrobium sp.]|nr:aminotransferase class I/II-fold pyridoxal phosphate-dependent enzyme [Hyphomicrobium sp.]